MITVKFDIKPPYSPEEVQINSCGRGSASTSNRNRAMHRPLTPDQIRRIAQAVNGGKVRGGIISLASEMKITRQTIDFWLAKKHPPSNRLDRLLRQVAEKYHVDLE